MLCMRVARLVYLVFCAAAPATCDLQTMLCAVYPHRLHYLVHIPRCAAPRTRCQHKQPELIRACLHIVWNSICTEPQFTSTSMPVPLVFFFFHSNTKLPHVCTTAGCQLWWQPQLPLVHHCPGRETRLLQVCHCPCNLPCASARLTHTITHPAYLQYPCTCLSCDAIHPCRPQP